VRQILILGAGFGGLELATLLSGSFGDDAQVTLIDQNDAFLFGFSKLDVLVGRQSLDEVRLPYRDIALPGVTFRQERVVSVNARSRRAVTDSGTYDPDILVVALGADYDPAATVGFVEDGYEFYSPAGAERLRDRLATFSGGTVILAILGVPFKCPPAPYEAAMLIHEYLVERGIRDVTDLQVITPMDSPIPVSGETSAVIVRALAERGIAYTPGQRVTGLDPARHIAHLATGDRPYNLFVGVPVHRLPAVVAGSELTTGGTDGWIAVNPRTLQTRYSDVHALGDCADAPVPRAGVFAESAARAVADHITAGIRGVEPTVMNDGTGSCYVEFGAGQVGRVDADFLSGPSARAPFVGPTVELKAEKSEFARTRQQRWFGR
jgi:sulfide:quinone oxidoreductase